MVSAVAGTSALDDIATVVDVPGVLVCVSAVSVVPSVVRSFYNYEST